ncbi:ras-related protein RSR1-like [Haliotis rubra]|uniref:ras-related protein RSR1-like n=1 Tax=Haliotis rubra TaxID=36100 RepID=UPI001EE55A1A|nr:ras-related protein RSR1-like [Haliotis rubra]
MGAAACGKTSFLNQYLQQIFQHTYFVTVGEIHTTPVEVEGKPVDLDIWDTPGGLYFEALRMRAIQNCDAFLLVYAMDDIESFEKAIALQEDIMEMRGPVTTVFIGTKADLKSSQWLEQQHQFSDFVSERIGCAHHEVSAKTGSGISEVFVDIFKQWQKGQKKPRKSKIPKWLKNVSIDRTLKSSKGRGRDHLLEELTELYVMLELKD